MRRRHAIRCRAIDCRLGSSGAACGLTTRGAAGPGRRILLRPANRLASPPCVRGKGALVDEQIDARLGNHAPAEVRTIGGAEMAKIGPKFRVPDELHRAGPKGYLMMVQTGYSEHARRAVVVVDWDAHAPYSSYGRRRVGALLRIFCRAFRHAQ